MLPFETLKRYCSNYYFFRRLPSWWINYLPSSWCQLLATHILAQNRSSCLVLQLRRFILKYLDRKPLFLIYESISALNQLFLWATAIWMLFRTISKRWDNYHDIIIKAWVSFQLCFQHFRYQQLLIALETENCFSFVVVIIITLSENWFIRI